MLIFLNVATIVSAIVMGAQMQDKIGEVETKVQEVELMVGEIESKIGPIVQMIENSAVDMSNMPAVGSNADGTSSSNGGLPVPP